MNFSAAIFLCLFSSIACRGLHEEFSWTRLSYDWPGSGSEPRSASASSYGGYYGNGRKTTARPRPTRPGSTPRPDSSDVPYIYQNNIPMGANIWNNKLFITVPRRRPGVPATLSYIPVNSTQRHNVPLIPYPDWETNTLPEEGQEGHRFISVYRTAVDSCDRLWFVDTGLVETPGSRRQIQPIALVIMDLKTDKVIQRHEFNSSVLTSNTGLASVTVDITNSQCGDAFAYIPDLSGYGLIVYSLRQDKAWRVNHNYFFVEPLGGEFLVGGHRFQWNDGIFSIALSDVKSDGFRDAYFHSMAGLNQYRVSTKILKNENLATRSFHEEDFELIGSRGKNFQTSSADLHKSTGVLFLGLVNQNALGCWNTKTPLSDISIVQKDDQKMIYPSDVKIVGDTVVVLTNTMPVFLYGTLDYDVTNFRVWAETVSIAVRGTKCDPRANTKY